MSPFTRGFAGRGRTRDPRLPPGQYDTGGSWPVLTAEATPKLDTASWSFTIEGLVEQPTTWTWDQIRALPLDGYDGAIHCVTTWSKFDMHWQGVSLDTLLAVSSPLSPATHVVAYSHTGYTTNLPLEDVTSGKAWVAFEVDGAPARSRSRWPGAAARAAPLLLEERQVGRRTPSARPRRARVLGGARLPRPR
jgi:DMSO/TMAO reductase YedYZ molybdopterin-dependent catalytic subunit